MSVAHQVLQSQQTHATQAVEGPITVGCTDRTQQEKRYIAMGYTSAKWEPQAERLKYETKSNSLFFQNKNLKYPIMKVQVGTCGMMYYGKTVEISDF